MAMKLVLIILNPIRLVRIVFIVKKIKTNLVEEQADAEQMNQYNI